jgi:hypothetical protein
MATDTPTKVIVDCSTGEETILPLTADEIAQMEIDRAKAEADRATAEAEAEAKAEAKASALAKLAALGLTEEEAASIAG